MGKKDVTLYDVLKVVENVFAETKGINNRLDKVQLELSEFKAEMNEFKTEMYEFNNKTTAQLDLLNGKVNQALNGMEALNQRVWRLEKQSVETAD